MYKHYPKCLVLYFLNTSLCADTFQQRKRKNTAWAKPNTMRTEVLANPPYKVLEISRLFHSPFKGGRWRLRISKFRKGILSRAIKQLTQSNNVNASNWLSKSFPICLDKPCTEPNHHERYMYQQIPLFKNLPAFPFRNRSFL